MTLTYCGESSFPQCTFMCMASLTGGPTLLLALHNHKLFISATTVTSTKHVKCLRATWLLYQKSGPLELLCYVTWFVLNETHCVQRKKEILSISLIFLFHNRFHYWNLTNLVWLDRCESFSVRLWCGIRECAGSALMVALIKQQIKQQVMMGLQMAECCDYEWNMIKVARTRLPLMLITLADQEPLSGALITMVTASATMTIADGRVWWQGQSEVDMCDQRKSCYDNMCPPTFDIMHGHHSPQWDHVSLDILSIIRAMLSAPSVSVTRCTCIALHLYCVLHEHLKCKFSKKFCYFSEYAWI